MDKMKQEQDRIARLQAENHAALRAAQEGTEEDGWQTFERTPERQNMTKPEDVTQEDRDLVKPERKTAMNKDDVARLVEKLTPALKLLEEFEVGQDCAEYAYAKGNGFQSMTYIPEAFEALRELPATLDALTTLSARVETLEAGMSQYLKDGQTPLERMEQDQADILGLMKLLQKEKELTEKLRWALSDAVTTNTESCRERDAALHRIEAARLGIIEGLEMEGRT